MHYLLLWYIVIGIIVGSVFSWMTEEEGGLPMIFISGLIWPIMILSIPFCLIYDLIRNRD
mgnify:CR=1 FL=1